MIPAAPANGRRAGKGKFDEERPGGPGAGECRCLPATNSRLRRWMDTTPPVTPDRWSLDSWFTGFGAPDYVDFKEAIARDLAAFTVPDKAEALAQSVADYEALMTRYWHLSSYLGCLSADDANDEAVKADEAWAATLDAECSKMKSALQGALAALSTEAFVQVLASPVLAGAEHTVRRMREDGRLQMTQEFMRNQLRQILCLQ